MNRQRVVAITVHVGVCRVLSQVRNLLLASGSWHGLTVSRSLAIKDFDIRFFEIYVLLSEGNHGRVPSGWNRVMEMTKEGS